MSEDIHERVARLIHHRSDSRTPGPGAYAEILRREYGKMVDAQVRLQDERDGNAIETSDLEAKLAKALEALNWIGSYAREVLKEIDDE